MMLEYPLETLGHSRSSAFTTFRSHDEVEQAAHKWATDLGWRRAGPALSFALEPFLFPQHVHVEVAIIGEAPETTVIVTALMPISAGGDSGPYLGEGTPDPMAGLLAEVGASFSAGIADRLEAMDANAPRGTRNHCLPRFVRFDQDLRRLFWPLLTLGPVLFAITAALRGFKPYPVAMAAALLWGAALYVTYHFLRWRTLAMGYGWLLILALALWVGMLIAAGFTLGG